MAVSGHKYDPGKKPSKCKTEPKKPKAATVMKATEPETQESTITPADTHAEEDTEDRLLYHDDDDDDGDLHDPFAQTGVDTTNMGPRVFDTKDPTVVPKKPCKK